MNIDQLRDVLAQVERAGVALPDLDLLSERSRALGQAKAAGRALADSRLVQILLGIPIVLIGGSVWADQIDRGGLLFFSGLIVHAYGLLLIAFGVAVRLLARRVDAATPIIGAQEGMARIQRIAGLEGWILGMIWLVLWIPAIAVLVYVLSGFDVFRLASGYSWLTVNLVCGVVAIAGLWLLRRWARASGRDQLAQNIDDLLTGSRVSDATRALQEVRRFAVE